MAKKSKVRATKKASKRGKVARKTAKRSAKAASRKATRKAAPASRKTGRTTGKAGKPGKPGKPGKGKKAKRAARKTTRRAATTPRKMAKSAKPASARKTAGAVKTAASTKSPSVQQARRAVQSRTASALGRRPNLDRERRTIREEEEMVPSPPSSLDMDRSASAARTGRAEYEQKLREHTSTGPAMTGGDIDADWEDAESVGDEAPGGDNPTPDQDVVDEIGRAMGIEYDDDEELQGGDELAQRDRHRWELDPASKEDFDEE